MNKDQRIELIIADITTVEAEIVVNAANEKLAGGGGVDGAIHRAAGPGLLAECKTIGGCPTGKACLTAAYNLKARYVIHTVGPVWRGGHRDEHMLLASCYRESLLLAASKEAASIVFPSISTGAYSFPPEQASFIAVTEVKRFLSKNRFPQKVIFVVFDSKDYSMYKKLLNNE